MAKSSIILIAALMVGITTPVSPAQAILQSQDTRQQKLEAFSTQRIADRRDRGRCWDRNGRSFDHRQGKWWNRRNSNKERQRRWLENRWRYRCQWGNCGDPDDRWERDDRWSRNDRWERDNDRDHDDRWSRDDHWERDDRSDHRGESVQDKIDRWLNRRILR